MYVCICAAATEARVREAVQGGETTVRGLQERLAVATRCGRCGPAVTSILKAERRRAGGTLPEAQPA